MRTARVRAVCWATGLLVAVSTSGCGGPAERHLAIAAATVNEIRSGRLDMRLTVTPSSMPAYGFAIRGPFRLVGAGDLEADLRYSQRAGTEEAQVRFLAVGGRAFVVAEGAFYELPATRQASAVQAPTVLHGLGFEGWAAAPRLVVEETPDEITVVSRLDEVEALSGIVDVLDELEFREAAGLASLGSLGEAAVERAVRGGTMTVRVGGSDGLLRSLVVRLRVRIGRAAGLARPMATLADAEMVFSVGIANPNERVRIRLARIPR